MNGVRLVPFADQRVMPWANGGGSTREVAIDPPDGSWSKGFRWRVSRASVHRNGPFSRLPGLDRSLWLWSGAGMKLDVGGTEVVLERPLQRCDFAGETSVSAELRGGPCEDLNVMVDRARARADARIVELAAGAAWSGLAAAQHVLLVLSGQLRLADGTMLALTGDVLLRGDGGPLDVVAVAPTVALACDFMPR
jgi:environmental stress-induced protein Ves